MVSQVLGHHGRGDSRNIFVMHEGKLEELTPVSDSLSAAIDLTRAMGQRFYLRKSAGPEGVEVWLAVDILRPAETTRRFPTQDAAVMFAALRGSM